MIRPFACLLFSTVWILAGCSAPESSESAENKTSSEQFSEMPLEAVTEYVQTHYPATAYATNSLLPEPGVEPQFTPLAEPIKIKVGMPWVLNDEEAAWYVAAEKGYFAEYGLDVEFLPGGPGRDHLMTVLAGSIDIAVSASSASFLRLINSRTSGDLVTIAAFLKRSPYSWMMLDKSIPSSERSTLVVTPEVLKGKKVGIQAGYEFIWPVLAQKWGMQHDDIQIMKVGFTPATLMQGTVDFYAAWIVNQPRILEENGYYNWTAIEFYKEGIGSQNDISVVRRETFENQPDMLRRYLAALTKATQFLLDEPEAAAEITQRWATDAELSIPQILRRFELQRSLVESTPDSPILHLDVEGFDRETATLLKYGQIESLREKPPL